MSPQQSQLSIDLSGDFSDSIRIVWRRSKESLAQVRVARRNLPLVSTANSLALLRVDRAQSPIRSAVLHHPTADRVGQKAGGRLLAHHAEHGDFSRWVRDVFADAELARQLRKIEARWRRGELPDLRRSVDALITGRYGGDD